MTSTIDLNEYKNYKDFTSRRGTAHPSERVFDMTNIVLSNQTRFYMVKTCLEQLELVFKTRSWKLGMIPPDPVKLMRISGHGGLVSFTSVIIAGESDCPAEDLQRLPLLGDLHDGDEAYLGDVSWPSHKFSIRQKLLARQEIFKGLKAGDIMIPLLNRLDEKKGNHDDISMLVKCHEDGHQVASLLEILAYIGAKMAEREDFTHSIETLRSKLFTPVGTQLFTDLANLKHLPVRSGVRWEHKLWEDLGFPSEEYPQAA